MRRRKQSVTTLIGLTLVVALLAAACGNSDKRAPRDTPKATATTGAQDQQSAAAEAGPDTPAASLRATLTGLLTEHVSLAAMATGAALRGDQAGFEAFAAALNGPTTSNTAELVAGVRSVYGDEVGKAFDGLWRAQGHIPAVVAYTQAVVKGDKVGADKAVNDLLAYAKTFGTTMNSVNSNLPAAAVEEAIKGHATTLKAVIDAQKAGDATLVAKTLREAVHHMSATADVLAEATVKLLPEKF